MTTERQPHILLVEDDQSQADLLMMGLDSAKGGFTISHVSDGAEAISYFDPEGDYAGEPRPDVVFLDLNLPKVSGLEVLEILKNNPSLRDIPVVVLSTSDNENDMSSAYQRGVNSYVKKPVGFDKFQQMCCDMRQYWVVLNMPPVKKAKSSSQAA